MSNRIDLQLARANGTFSILCIVLSPISTDPKMGIFVGTICGLLALWGFAIYYGDLKKEKDGKH